jgi:hypothetical protein
MTSPSLLSATRIHQIVTIETAWCLQRARIRVSDALLDEVREHVLLSLPPGSDVADLGVLTERFVADYLDRVMEHGYRGPPPAPTGLPRVDEGWRQALEQACDQLSLAVLRLFYGDGLPEAQVARQCGVDAGAVQAVREGLRELARAEVRVRLRVPPTPGPAWADALLTRVAGAFGASCPDAALLLPILGRGEPDGGHERRAREHAEGCPHCSRAVRLLRAGLLGAAQICQAAPPRPPDTSVGLLALLLHPHARQHLKGLMAALKPGVLRVGDDALLVDVGRVPGWKDALSQRVRMGLPARDHLRGALVRGLGRMTARVALGPAPLQALDQARARPWGEVDDIAALPDPMPPPPSVARWWSGAVAVGAIALLLGGWTVLGRRSEAVFPLRARIEQGGGAVVVRFEVDDRAYVNAYSLGPHGVVTELESRSAADKADIATDDGAFELVTFQPGLLIVSAPSPVDDLAPVFASADLWSGGERGLRDRILSLHPDSDVAVFLSGD